ncbi:MAG TPA: cupin, partial [Micromonosporaceae bacterium]|nr:cupin [Micromonosporaceae bacterium]
AAAMEGLTPDSTVAVRPGLRWALTPAGSDRVRLRVFDRELSFPAPCEPALRAVLSGGPHRVGDLPGLDADDALVLARRLLREAVAVPTG